MSTPERRHIPRTRLEKLAYINIEPNNGGIVLNVSHEGLCFHSIAMVEKNGPLRFSILEQNRRIAACGELAWTDEIQKIGGVRFTTLTAEAREQVQNWISQPAAALEEHHTSTLGSALLKAFPRFRAHRPDPITASGNSSAFAAALLNMRVRIKLSGFARGLATGLLISTFCASVFLLYAQRRDIGKSLIHLGERLAGPQLTAKPEAEQQPALSAPRVISPAKEPALPVRAQTAAQNPARAQTLALGQNPVSAQTALRVQTPVNASSPARPEIAAPSQATVRAQVPAVQPKKPLPQPLASSAKPEPVTLQSPAPANVVSHAANSPPQHPAVRDTFAATAPIPSAAAPEASSSLAANAFVNKAPAPPQPGSDGPVQVTSSSEAKAASLPLMFFELGKFKDELRARDLGDRVAQLGMHPSVVQKGHLWMNSFYVLVGPYGDAEAATRTQKDLVSHGYKPRPFERGSRNFTFISGLTLDSTTLPVGDFTISWESYVTDAKVKFAQGSDVLSTTDGQWVNRPRRYQRDEYVYVRSSNGSRLLREIHFSGLDRALVFRNPS